MERLRAVWRKVRWSVAQRGLLGTLRVAGQRARSAESSKAVVAHPFDGLHGMETSGWIGGGSLATGHVHDAYITGYVGVPPSRFLATMERWRMTGARADEYTFVDLGCGKGRAVLLASTLGFRAVVGVELNPELAKIAEVNREAWQAAGRAVAPIRIVCGDAAEFTLPEGPCLIYLYNPFGAPVLRRLLERIEAQRTARPGRVDVVYQNPEQEAVFQEFPAFELLWSEVIPASEEDAAVDPVCSPEDLCRAYRRA
jgi:SAM-dependent methyltransferase